MGQKTCYIAGLRHGGAFSTPALGDFHSLLQGRLQQTALGKGCQGGGP